MKEEGVIGIGIGGSEREFPPEPFQSVFQEARRMGFHTNAHAGEASGPQSVWGAVNHLHVDRIGHGARIPEDPALLDYIIEHAIPVELCPMSNVRTGVVKSIADHPIRKFFDRGMTISVNTDDPKMFGTSLAEEYRLLEVECGFSRRDICKLILLGIDSSWLSEEKKETLVASFEKETSWVG